MNLLVDGIGLLLILFIVWWFWLYRPRAAPPAMTAGHANQQPEEIRKTRP